MVFARLKHSLAAHLVAGLVLFLFACWSSTQEPGVALSAPGDYSNQPARAVLPWARNQIIYQVWLPSYGSQNALHNAEQHLDHIAKLGATMVQLSPVCLHSLAGGPYSIDDYYGIDPNYGTAQDLHSYIDHAHRLSIKVIIDVVFVHTSAQNPLVKQHPDYYVHNKQGRMVLTQWGLPHLDPSNPKTRAYLNKDLLYWADTFQVDGFRADVPPRMGTQFWNSVRDALHKAHPGLFMLAESTSPELMLHAFDASYGVGYMWTIDKIILLGAPSSEPRENWESDHAKFLRGTLLLRAIDNHDQRRAITQFDNRGALAGTVINMTMDGIPFIYNGKEIGDPTPTAVHYTDPIVWQQERTGAAHAEGYTLVRGGYRGEDLPTFEKLIAIRKTNPAFTEGKVRWIDNSDESRIVSYLRTDGSQKFVVLVNLTNQPWTGTIAMSPARSAFHPLLVYGAQSSALPDNRLPFTLGAWGYYVGALR